MHTSVVVDQRLGFVIRRLGVQALALSSCCCWPPWARSLNSLCSRALYHGSDLNFITSKNIWRKEFPGAVMHMWQTKASFWSILINQKSIKKYTTFRIILCLFSNIAMYTEMFQHQHQAIPRVTSEALSTDKHWQNFHIMSCFFSYDNYSPVLAQTHAAWVLRVNKKKYARLTVDFFCHTCSIVNVFYKHNNTVPQANRQILWRKLKTIREF